MKPVSRSIAFAICTFIGSTSFACAAADLTVDLDGLRAGTGLVQLAIVDGPDGWDDKAKPVAADGAPASGTTASFTFKDLPAGRYAVKVINDENGNGKFDTNVVGMPLEGYGFSNSPQVMRKPTFDEAAFDLPAAGARISIRMR